MKKYLCLLASAALLAACEQKSETVAPATSPTAAPAAASSAEPVTTSSPTPTP
ncbi:MAG TPA: hypothetical protein VKS98_07940 [Chthoniobacterales bacterium]|nr:hypothetical protein [Chthoniobacterales bacterium]